MHSLREDISVKNTTLRANDTTLFLAIKVKAPISEKAAKNELDYEI